MKKLALTIAFVIMATQMALAQSDKEIADAAIADAMADIAKMTSGQSEIPADSNAYKLRIEEMTSRLQALKELLANNGYVRVSGFSLGIPWGVSIDFEFLD